ncbi:MAG: AmmeMemoRadiSam system protein A [Bacteroidales bacterium]
MNQNQHSPQVKWARTVLESHFENKMPSWPQDGALQQQAGCFVSLHNPDGSLRGCIGTIMPTKTTLAEEIKTNALSAALMDPRFTPLKAPELKDLVVTVDVLGEPEAIESIEQLDPKIYGVIVSSGNRRGVLLPDLPGVDRIDQQLYIARQKAGIGDKTPIAVHRFTVHRYH